MTIPVAIIAAVVVFILVLAIRGSRSSAVGDDGDRAARPVPQDPSLGDQHHLAGLDKPRTIEWKFITTDIEGKKKSSARETIQRIDLRGASMISRSRTSSPGTTWRSRSTRFCFRSRMRGDASRRSPTCPARSKLTRRPFSDRELVWITPDLARHHQPEAPGDPGRATDKWA